MIPTPREIKKLLSLKNYDPILQQRQDVADIVTGKSRKIGIVVGPCSIHDVSSTIEYAKKLAELAIELRSFCFIAMRVYVEKARSTLGWKGLISDPYLDESGDIKTGIWLARTVMLEIAHLGLPIATEFLDPLLVPYTQDLVSWGFIGARTVTSQPHRLLASALPMPIGFKNTVTGSVSDAIDACTTASSPHTFPILNDDGRIDLASSDGNPHTHIVLRGSQVGPNYNQTSSYNRILIDCSHGNSQKDPLKQQGVFYSALNEMSTGNKNVMGVMLESHLSGSSQSIPEDPSRLKFGVSVTDPCLDWASTESLLLSIDSTVSRFTHN